MTAQSLVDLFGDHLIVDDGHSVETAAALEGCNAVGIYFSAHWCPPCRRFTPELARNYTSHYADKGLKIVFVSSDRSETAFKEYFSEMPWFAVPFAERDIKEKLSRKFKVNGIPMLVIVDQNGETITTDGRSAVADDPTGQDLPWRPKPVTDLLPKAFVDKDGSETTKESLQGKHLGLYFSAHWCPPCKKFTPLLAKWYNENHAKLADKFEIIFVSSDNSEQEYTNYLATMPWPAVPFGQQAAKAALEKAVGVNGIPTLAIISPDGAVITTSGRGIPTSDPHANYFPWIPETYNNLDSNPDGINDNPSVCVFFGPDWDCESLRDIKKNVFHPVAKKLASYDVSLYYSTDFEGEISEQIAGACGGLNEPGSKKATVLVVDIPDRGGYYVCAENVATLDFSVIEDAFEKYQKKSVPRQQMS
ncbi:hypothetical protein FOL47_005495 [Perkinsus chesapeaki]|uniref:Thioredoxin domain-containing protein n=1 Tax=Perkinsus chesapeaki TaxID=330153 RepID=A0A7J6LY64_PERCH|nr:hypothetical protein FOL47_005495 [Perkinsus chesapeaki]